MYGQVRTIYHIFIMVLDVSYVRLYDSIIKFFALISQKLTVVQAVMAVNDKLLW